MNTRHIPVTREQFDRVVKLRGEAVEGGHRRGSDTFLIDGAEVRIDYSEYVIEYMAMTLGLDDPKFKASRMKIERESVA